MFFRKAGKYLTILYSFYFAFFLILYFALFKEYGYASEVYSFSSIFSSFKELSLGIAAVILFYIVDMVSVVGFLTDFYDKRGSIAYYIYYIFSSIFGLIFYAFTFFIVFTPFKGLIARFKEVSLTEVPLLVTYFSLFILIVFLWKIITYWKIKGSVTLIVSGRKKTPFGKERLK
ncbi:hypothetical protein TTHT_1325 [Thermotomaculum hydrothermale]|uniref:Uncharacterized protein n=1 Tax=Thermotomaculum hydrothermale TaxID=981385 RepID=A0A7R6PXZ1_9BACT|nr:hypothetical protein [Thermotomaculum hydrothermale]BBB32840.1 hypothetical protein TTHT_1325 [Thermotomaculum hydrothermale]